MGMFSTENCNGRWVRDVDVAHLIPEKYEYIIGQWPKLY